MLTFFFKSEKKKKNIFHIGCATCTLGVALSSNLSDREVRKVTRLTPGSGLHLAKSCALNNVYNYG